METDIKIVKQKDCKSKSYENLLIKLIKKMNFFFKKKIKTKIF